jgi:DNA-binding SARP family transcriptional activator
VQYRVLGPLELLADGPALPIRAQKQLILLATLLLNANQVVSVDRLIDELWPFQQPAQLGESVQVLVYQVRKLLEAGAVRGSVLERQGNGYRLHTTPDELDSNRFERLVRSAQDARNKSDLESASWILAEALALWRGQALANVRFEAPTVSRAQAARLDEVRLSTAIERIEIDLELGREDELIGELEALVAEHPLDERLRQLQMLALYRCGRQAEALQSYQSARTALVDELGIEPSVRLQALHQSILRHDTDADRHRPPGEITTRTQEFISERRSVLAVAFAETDLDPLLAVATPLVQAQASRELILVMIVHESGEPLERANALVQEYRDRCLEAAVEARAAALVSTDSPADISRLARREDVDLLLLSAPSGLSLQGGLPSGTRTVLDQAPCDAGLLVRRDGLRLDGEVVVPFGGKSDDWTAVETGAWVASTAGTRLVMLGVQAPDQRGERQDASRLLADASLAVQQRIRVAVDTRLVDARVPDEFVHACSSASLVVLALPSDWRETNEIGPMRLLLAREASAPILFVRRGERPGGLAPRDSATIFSWSLMPPG